MSHPGIDRRRQLFPKPVPVQEQTHASVALDSKSYTLKSLSRVRSSNHEADQGMHKVQRVTRMGNWLGSPTRLPVLVQDTSSGPSPLMSAGVK